MDASSPTLQQLQEDIDLFQTLLISLEEDGQEEVEEDKEYYKRKLRELRAQVDGMGAAQSSETSRDSASRQSHASELGAASISTSTDRYPTRQLLNLPSRKRERGELDDELDARDLHRTKSRKSTPLDSPVPSRADSVGSDYFDDPSLGNLLGENWQEDVRRTREYMIQQEARKRQEEEDEKLARQLQEQWSESLDSSSQNRPPRPAFPSAQQTQATFRPNGSFSVSAPTASEIRQDQLNDRNLLSNNDTTSAIPLNSSDEEDEDLAFVSPTEWNRLYPSASGITRGLPAGWPQALNRLGTNPTLQSSYTSLPGTSVYGNSSQSQQNSSFLSRLPSLQSFNPFPGFGSLGGTQSYPFDLERITKSFLGREDGSPLPHSWEVRDSKETQEEIRQLLHNIRPDEEIDPSEASENQPVGLKVRLMPHQVKGLAWMKKMEDGSNKGGILADDMGLGKTVQAISLMLSRPPPDDAKRPTLIVTPVALMDQWRREILKMVRNNASFTILILHGPNAPRSWSKVKHYDIMLTSYGTLASELKRRLKWQEKSKLNPDLRKTDRDECAVLDNKSKFHRVFLDEAQNIKNRNTQTAIAACRIQSDYRWCLSGTPMQNGVEEIYSLIKFCRIRPYNDIEQFNKAIARPLKARHEAGQDRAMEKLQALLKAILLRRTKKSKIDGEPILQLPEKHTIENRAVFGKDQLEFYKALERQSRVQFNKFVRDGRIGQNYSKALVLLLRLRQCCCSPQLVTNSADFVMDSGIEGIDLVANARQLPKDVVARIKEQEDTECPICIDAVENPIIFNPCGHMLCHDCFSRMVDNVHAENADNVKCPHCRARIDSNKITDHVSFKEVYLGIGGSSMAEKESESDDDSDSDSDDDDDDDSSDDDKFWSDGSDDGEDLKDFVVNDDASVEEGGSSDDDEDDLDRIKKPKKPKKPTLGFKSKGKKKAKDKSKGKKKKSKSKKEHKSLAELRKEGLKSRAAKKKYLRQLGKLYEPCTKIDKTLEILHEIQARGENEKTIVFSSFTSFLDLIEVPLSQDPNLSKYTRYDGSMTAKDRNAAVLRFTDDPNCRVILVSLKAGNAGLNLTVANHVIIEDPFWNPFVEYQAADRCHRIGQRREVTVHRVLIGNEDVDYTTEEGRGQIFTVEDRILQLQEKKRNLVENALDENAASSVARLGVRELGYLFGVNEMPAINSA